MPARIATQEDRERRRKALELIRQGIKKAEVARRVGRSRWTIHQWWNEYKTVQAVLRMD